MKTKILCAAVLGVSVLAVLQTYSYTATAASAQHAPLEAELAAEKDELPVETVGAASAQQVAVKTHSTSENGAPFVEVEHLQFEITPGSGPVGVSYSSDCPDSPGVRTVWGSSYAISTELLQLQYQGKAKAAANVYQGKRIGLERAKDCF